MSCKGKFQFSIDRGGTFTDVFAKCPNGNIRVLKLLSEDPSNYKDAPVEAIRRIVESELKEPLEKSIHYIEWIRMGTTVATNALLEHKGASVGLLVTKGFRDFLRIGYQTRPNIFDLKVEEKSDLFTEVIEVQERVILSRVDCDLKYNESSQFIVKEPLNEKQLRLDLKDLLDKGITSLAVVLMHSYGYSEHERRIKEIAIHEFGFRHVSISSSVSPMIRIISRGFTTLIDAYLTPCLKDYIQGFLCGLKVKSEETLNVLFMQSDGGLTSMNHFTGSRAILSGPAGGVIGYSRTCPIKTPLIGFDMGGTSTDVSRFDGKLEHIFESNIAGNCLQGPQCDVNTVAAGGGSILSFRSGLFVVGPESAGSHPGPMCYRKGGPLTLTDANLVLGRILPSYFPKIFGTNKDEELDKESPRKALHQLSIQISNYLGKELTVEDVALGFIRVANESMCRPIRNLTQGKGHDVSKHSLAVFGGAGGQHAVDIARSLRMKEIFIHRYAGILSAYGMSLADVIHEEQIPTSFSFQESSFEFINQTFHSLSTKCQKALSNYDNYEEERYLNMRYEGTGCALMIMTFNLTDYKKEFCSQYDREFGFTLPNRNIIVDDIRIRGIGRISSSLLNQIDEKSMTQKNNTPMDVTSIYFENGYLKTNVYSFSKLISESTLIGPALIIDDLSTILLHPECSAVIDRQGNLRISVSSELNSIISSNECDPVQLSIFSHRFMSIAEQMGRVLQRTAISTNIKERLDFSCALFGPQGGLVSNAPHIPVHLGAMQEAVRYQLPFIRYGDVILSNHPLAGGSHLPDITVITPVYSLCQVSPIFFVANRGHHADIGGLTPGSMPPHSKTLNDEGATFISFKVVQNGVFAEEELREKLKESRSLEDNIADIKAQIAANQKGILLVQELIEVYSLPIVQNYMKYIQNHAEVAVRDLLRRIGIENSLFLSGRDLMDDGTVIDLNITIDVSKGSAVFDFTGTGLEVYGNTNTPRAVTLSAIIYALRTLIGYDIPLNQGILNPVTVILSLGCILNPSDNAAVVGGNVLTSQRVVDVILRAFQVVAASQGCCNNITFGDETFGYYETLGGGCGAGPSWNGRSAVHVHMSNTRLTDHEILEQRYPVILKEFSVAQSTGGNGAFRGGNGLYREIIFRKSLDLSVLTERRVISPYGLLGGDNGTRGFNHLKRKEKIINLGGKCSITVEAGDSLCVQTPGGGGYGKEKIDEKKKVNLNEGVSISEVKVIPFGSLHDYSLRQESV